MNYRNIWFAEVIVIFVMMAQVFFWYFFHKRPAPYSRWVTKWNKGAGWIKFFILIFFGVNQGNVEVSLEAVTEGFLQKSSF